MNFKSANAVCVILALLLGQEVTSTTAPITSDEDESYRIADAESLDALCASCKKFVKPQLEYIHELKDQLTDVLAHLQTDKENIKLRKKLSDVAYSTQQIRDLYKRIERVEDSEMDLKRDLRNLREIFENEKRLHDMAVRNELGDHKAKEKVLSDDILELKSQVLDLKKRLEESQNQLADKNLLIETHAFKLNQTDNDLFKCREKLPYRIQCKGLLSGIHQFANPEVPGANISVLCNNDIANGGWIVVHKRFDGSENFRRNWTEFREGFGKLDGEFFVGLELLNRITNSQRYELYIELGYFNGTIEYARYDHFRIGNESSKYTLESLGEFNGTAKNELIRDINQKFSTWDSDDHDSIENCAEHFYGASWYDDCGGPNLNGQYYESEKCYRNCITWTRKYPLKSVQMLIQPKF